MKSPLEVFRRFRRSYTDVVGVDIGASATKVTRLKKVGQAITVVAADILPAVPFAEGPDGRLSGSPAPLDLPRPARGRYVTLAASAKGSVVKLLNVPAQAEKSGELQIGELLGIGDEAGYRIAYEVVGEGHGRSESRILAVAMPEDRARALCDLFPSGIPAPCAIELAGLASLHSFRRGPGKAFGEECVAVVDFGAVSSFLAIFNKGSLVLLRKFESGSDAILTKVEESLGVDRETAQGIFADGSFDVSLLVREAIGALSQQIIISRDFVERRENCHIRKLFVSGGVTGARDWQNEIRVAVGVPPETWNPFEGLQLAPDALPARLAGMESRFVAAAGAALAALEES